MGLGVIASVLEGGDWCCCVAMLKHLISLAEMQVEGRLGGIRISALGSRWVALFVVVVALLISL